MVAIGQDSNDCGFISPVQDVDREGLIGLGVKIDDSIVQQKGGIHRSEFLSLYSPSCYAKEE